MNLRPRKSLGQHFLTDESVAQTIVSSIIEKEKTGFVLEIGPGKGVLTKYLIKHFGENMAGIEIDERMVSFLNAKFPGLKLIQKDFLEMELPPDFPVSFSLIGNFPYNISSQILFKTLSMKERIPLLVGMFQKEVARRISSGHGTKEYGILSVLMQAFYVAEYISDVPEKAFDPPPKVKSGVVRFIRKEKFEVRDETYLYKVVKAAFNQRRKKLSNSLKDLLFYTEWRDEKTLGLRPEQLSVEAFVSLSNSMFDQMKNKNNHL